MFPLRRRAVLWGLAYATLVGIGMVIWLPHVLTAGGGQRVSAVVALVAYVIGAVCGVWQWIAQRPVVTVDRDGIRWGRRKFMPWSEVGAIGIAGGPVWARAVPIIPRDAFGKDLMLSQQHVRDMPAFRRWLETLLAEYSRSARSGETAWR